MKISLFANGELASKGALFGGRVSAPGEWGEGLGRSQEIWGEVEEAVADGYGALETREGLVISWELSPEEVLTSGDYTYAQTGWDTARIVGYYGTDANVTVPDSIGCLLRVTEIGTGAFRDSLELETLVLPKYLWAFGEENHWGCPKLRSITHHDGEDSGIFLESVK